MPPTSRETDAPAQAPYAFNARPYAFLDDAPLEERRTQAVQTRRYADASSPDDLGRLDADAIDAVREEAWPQVRSADEMHEALMGLGAVTAREARENGWADWLARLVKAHRATKMEPPAPDRPVGLRNPDGHGLWVAAERLQRGDLERVDLRPDAGRRAEVGDAALGRDPCAREDDARLPLSQQRGQELDLRDEGLRTRHAAILGLRPWTDSRSRPR